MNNPIRFSFRVILYPTDSDSPEISMWVHEHFYDKMSNGKGVPNNIEDWIRNALYDTDWRDLPPKFNLNLQDNETYELLGTASLGGYYSYDGEYDEDLDIESVSAIAIDTERTDNDQTQTT